MDNKEHIQYNGVEEIDFLALENVFKAFCNDTDYLKFTDPLLLDTANEFLLNVGIKTKNILEKYGKQNHLLEKEAALYQKKYVDLNRKVVKMKLKIKQVENAINAFQNASK